jgi:hypothetical protein
MQPLATLLRCFVKVKTLDDTKRRFFWPSVSGKPQRRVYLSAIYTERQNSAGRHVSGVGQQKFCRTTQKDVGRQKLKRFNSCRHDIIRLVRHKIRIVRHKIRVFRHKIRVWCKRPISRRRGLVSDETAESGTTMVAIKGFQDDGRKQEAAF